MRYRNRPRWAPFSLSNTNAAVLSVLLCLATFGLAQADPWPDYSSHTDYVPYVEVLTINTTNNLWDYLVTVGQGSYEPGHGGLAGVKALAVFPNGGNAEPALDGWTGDSSYVRPNWDTNGGWHTQQGAFGYRTSAPSCYIKPGQSNVLPGTASFPSGYAPPSQVYLVHVACSDGFTYWARPGVVPEPASGVALAAGFVTLLGMIRRKSRWTSRHPS